MEKFTALRESGACARFVLTGALLAAFFYPRGGGNVDQIVLVSVESELYVEEDIQDAADAVLGYSKKGFDGCTLTELRCAGGEASEQFARWEEQYQVDEAVVLLSTFDVGSSGGDGALNPNYTCRDWGWGLGRNAGGAWEPLTCGYG